MSYTDFKGPGIALNRGPRGPKGDKPEHRWSGTTLQIQNPDGTWPAGTNLRGVQGIQGIQGIKGDKGDQGIQGIQGIQGAIGPAGPTGDVTPAATTARDQAVTARNEAVTARDQAVAATSGKVSKTGDTMTGDLKVQSSAGRIILQNTGASGNEWWVFSAADGNFAVRNQTGAQTLFVITPDGKVNLTGQSDILSHVNTKVPLSGGTMTAPLTIANPNSDVSDVILISRLFPDAGYRLRARNDGFFAIVTREDGLSKFSINPEGRIWSRAIALQNANEGDLINWVTSQIAAAKAEAMATPAYGAIRFSGTFAVPDTTAIAPGDNIAGSRLRPAGLYFANPSATDDLRAAGGVMNIGSTGMSGTWQCKSYFGSASGHRLGEFLRVS